MKKCLRFSLSLIILALVGVLGTSIHAEPLSHAWDVKAGFIGSNLSIFGDLTTFPNQFSGFVASTRFDLGVVHIDGGGSLAAHVNEIASFSTTIPSLTAYVGGGLSLPLSSNGSMGLDIFVGIEQETAFFRALSERFFVELGSDSFTANRLSVSGSTLMAGFKFAY